MNNETDNGFPDADENEDLQSTIDFEQNSNPENDYFTIETTI